MQIAGLLPTSLQDYPGEIAAVVFTRGCNFHCPYCHNPELIGGKVGTTAEAGNMSENQPDDLPLYEEAEVLDLLAERTDYLDGVVITGGEPALQPDLADFLQVLKSELGYKIKLDTNGSRPELLEDLLAAELVDMVAWDYKLPRKRYTELTSETDIEEKIGKTGRILASFALRVEIRTTVVPGLITGQDIEKISREVNNLGDNGFPDSFILQEFSSEQVLDSKFSEISPYRREKMQEFKKISAEKLGEKAEDKVKIRGEV